MLRLITNCRWVFCGYQLHTGSSCRVKIFDLLRTTVGSRQGHSRIPGMTTHLAQTREQLPASNSHQGCWGYLPLRHCRDLTDSSSGPWQAGAIVIPFVCFCCSSSSSSSNSRRSRSRSRRRRTRRRRRVVVVVLVVVLLTLVAVVVAVVGGIAWLCW